MWLRLPIDRPRHYVPIAWPTMEPPDMRPTAAYLWDKVGPPHATNACSYVEFSNELDALVPSSISIFTNSSKLLCLTS